MTAARNCDFEPASQQEVAEAVAYLVGITTGIGIDKIIKNGSFGNWAFTIASAVMSIAAYWHATAGDDFVGLVTVPRGLDPAMNPKRIMNEDPPTTRGYVYMQFRPTTN